MTVRAALGEHARPLQENFEEALEARRRLLLATWNVCWSEELRTVPWNGPWRWLGALPRAAARRALARFPATGRARQAALMDGLRGYARRRRELLAGAAALPSRRPRYAVFLPGDYRLSRWNGGWLLRLRWRPGEPWDRFPAQVSPTDEEECRMAVHGLQRRLLLFAGGQASLRWWRPRTA